MELAVLCPPRLADLYRECDFVDRVIETAANKSVFRTGARLRRDHHDLVVLLPASWRVVMEALLGGVRRRAGYRVRGRGRFVINQKVPLLSREAAGEHQALGWLRAVEYYGGRVAPEAPSLSGGTGERALGVIAPGAEYGPAKRWPAERFAEVAEGLRQAVADWVVVGSAGDAAAAAAVEARLGDGCRNLCGRTSLKELIALLRGAKLVVCNDSGVMHLAAACGAPVVAVFGSTEPRLTRPIHGGVAIVRKHVPCSPCFRRECPLGHYDCLERVRPDDVLALAKGAVDGRKGRPVAGLAWEPAAP